MKKIKRGLINVLLLLLAACMLFTGCKPAPAPDNGDTTLNNGGEGNGGNNDVGNQNTGGNENGGEINESQGLESIGVSGEFIFRSIPYCGFKSDKTEFEIDDVTFEFYYGICLDNMRDVMSSTGDIPRFELCFMNDREERVTVKQVEENFISEKYKLDITWNPEKQGYDKKYYHSETITIPEEIFTRKKGMIVFAIYGDRILDGVTYSDTRITVSNFLYYKKSDGKVVLSLTPFD